MKTFIAASLVFFVSLSLSAQTYRIGHKDIKKTSKKPKWELTINYSQLEGNNGPSQDGFNKLIKQRMNAEKDSFIVWMKDWSNESSGNSDMGSYYDVNDTVIYVDNDLASCQFYVNSYFSGAAHPNNWSFSINYDLKNNKEIELKDVFTGDYLKTLSDYCIKEVLKQKQEFDSSMTSPDEFLLDGASPKEENYKVFNFTKEGFVVTFPTYQVGAYVEGPHEVTVPYDLLRKYYKKGSVAEKF